MLDAMFDLSNKRALVTGASGGLGSAIAKALHSAGAVVALSGRNEAKLQAVAQELGGERTHVAPCDLGDLAAVKALPEQAKDAMGGGVEILVNNAGLTKDNLFMRMTDEEWDDVQAVNLSAGYHLARGAIRDMTRAKWGRIIGITSVVGVTGNPGQANYCASKAGMIGMMKALAGEVASRNITANCVAPGFIKSEMTDKLSDEQKQKILEVIPAKAMGEGEDIAAAVLFLASPAARYVTGQTLHVNGGMAMI